MNFLRLQFQACSYVIIKTKCSVTARVYLQNYVGKPHSMWCVSHNDKYRIQMLRMKQLYFPVEICGCTFDMTIRLFYNCLK